MKGKKTPTIRDIAKELGISPATVSNALTGNRYVHENTIRKIKKTAKELGYRANIYARSLRTQRTNVIGVTIPDNSEPYISMLVRYVENELRSYGFDMFLGSYYFDLEEEIRLLMRFKDFMVDGVIAISGLDTTNEAYVDLNEYIPVVFLERASPTDEVVCVMNDHKKAAINAVDYLVQNGHERIIHLTIPYENFGALQLRADGFLEGLKKNGIKRSKSSVIQDPNIRLHEIDTSINIAKKIADIHPTAVFVVSDYVAIGLIKGLSQIGVKIPDDISIISVTNIDYCLVTTPQLTSIDLSPKTSAKKTARIINKYRDGNLEESGRIEIPTKIIERESVKKLK